MKVVSNVLTLADSQISLQSTALVVGNCSQTNQLYLISVSM